MPQSVTYTCPDCRREGKPHIHPPENFYWYTVPRWKNKQRRSSYCISHMRARMHAYNERRKQKRKG